MRNLVNIKIFASFLLVILFVQAAKAQKDSTTLDEQTVIIYNEYTPVLKDANRIQSLPVILDTVKVEPRFEYEIIPTMYKTSFTPSKIAAATIKGEQLKPLPLGMVKIGYGNYISPYFEGYINSKRQKDYSLGLAAKHHSSFGKIKNILDQKIYSGYDETDVEAYAKKIFSKSVFGSKINFSTHGINYYGYDPYIYGDSIKMDGFNYADTKDEIEQQRYNRLSANIKFESMQTGLKHWNYLLDAKYQYFFTKTKDYQHKAAVKANIGRTTKKISYGLAVDFDFDNNKISAIDTSFKHNQIILGTEPYFRFDNGKWKIKLGVNACGELLDSVKYHFYPDVYAQLNISNTLIPYIKYSGHLDNNNLEFVSRYNPFVNNIANFGTTDYQHDANIGIKANISKKIFLQVNANYSHINDLMLFVNDTTTALHNKFTMDYADADRIGAYLELSLRDLTPGLEISLKGRYDYYLKLQNADKAWQIPDLDISLKAAYKLTNDISFGIEGYFVNASFAKEYDASGNILAKKQKSIIDVNLFGEYHIDESFSVFLHINNLACQKYYIWNNYRAQGFNFLAGLTYNF